jgi:hypothetical protein
MTLPLSIQVYCWLGSAIWELIMHPLDEELAVHTVRSFLSDELTAACNNPMTQTKKGVGSLAAQC